MGRPARLGSCTVEQPVGGHGAGQSQQPRPRKGRLKHWNQKMLPFSTWEKKKFPSLRTGPCTERGLAAPWPTSTRCPQLPHPCSNEKMTLRGKFALVDNHRWRCFARKANIRRRGPQAAHPPPSLPSGPQMTGSASPPEPQMTPLWTLPGPRERK